MRTKKVYALNAENGSVVWSYETGGDVDSSPAVADRKVFIGSNDGYLYVLNAESGGLIQKFYTYFSIGSSPAVAYGKIYVGSENGWLYAYGPTPKPAPEPGTPNWVMVSGLALIVVVVVILWLKRHYGW
ncbi:MAG: PQQ-binding-like beta-propeller repeat protein [Candidatus Hadarchaeota archaeon]